MNRYDRLMIQCLCILAPGFATTAALAGAPLAGGMPVDKVWAGHPVGFALLTERGHQFIAYYDAERRLTVAGRKLEDKSWTRVHPDGVPVPHRDRDSNVTGWDSHNRLAMALDRDGCLHLSGNMHADPLVYYRTRKPFDLASLERIDRMTGVKEDRVTYPKFFRDGEGGLCFSYREGGSGNGNDIYNIYDPEKRGWRRLIDTPLLDGEGERSAYSGVPALGPDGRFHLLWMWRETPDALSNNTLSYARSRDLVHWESSSGVAIPLPITRAKGEIIDPAKPGEGLINMCYLLGFDDKQRPVAVYHRFDGEGHSQAFAARPAAAGKWNIRQLSDWDFRWNFAGGGSQASEISLGSPVPDGKGGLLVGFSGKKPGSGRWRLDGETLAPVETLPAVRSDLPSGFAKPAGRFPGIGVRTKSSRADGNLWVLRWETLGPNRDLKNRDVPPPGEMLLYEFPREQNSRPTPAPSE